MNLELAILILQIPILVALVLFYLEMRSAKDRLLDIETELLNSDPAIREFNEQARS